MFLRSPLIKKSAPGTTTPPLFRGSQAGASERALHPSCILDLNQHVSNDELPSGTEIRHRGHVMMRGVMMNSALDRHPALRHVLLQPPEKQVPPSATRPAPWTADVAVRLPPQAGPEPDVPLW